MKTATTRPTNGKTNGRASKTTRKRKAPMDRLLSSLFQWQKEVLDLGGYQIGFIDGRGELAARSNEMTLREAAQACVGWHGLNDTLVVIIPPTGEDGKPATQPKPAANGAE